MLWKKQPAETSTEIKDLRALSDALNSVQAVIWFDTKGNILQANTNFCAAMGYQETEIVGKHHRIFVDPALHGSDAYAALWDNLAQGISFSGDIERITATGERLQLAAFYTPVKDVTGAVVKVVKFASDITAKRQAVADLTAALATLSEGDVSVRLPRTTEGEFKNVFERFNGTMQTLETMIKSINAVALTLAKDAADITANAQDLAGRGEAQAATLEETAASLEQLSTAVAGTAENAQSATATAKTASGDAKQGTQVVSNAISAMQEIKDGSSEIGKIIEVIDAISFQTNLLALNAGIEAARAGDAGRGFAVVASEIRALAQRTAEAAKDISDLIVSSNTNVAKGAQLVDQSGEALTRIVDQIATVVETIEEISTATRDQSDGVNSVNQATSHMDIATQQNAALAERSAQSAGQLADSAAKLRDLVSAFETSDDGLGSIGETMNFRQSA